MQQHYTQTTTRQYVLSYSGIHTEIQRLPLSVWDSLSHTHSLMPSVSISTVHAMSRDRASCTVNVSAVQMINVTRSTIPNVARVPLSSRLTFCVQLTPGLQVKIAAPSCSSPPTHNLLCVHWDIRPGRS